MEVWLNDDIERVMPLKEEFIIYISWEKGTHHTTPPRKFQGGQEAEDGSKGRAQAKAFIGVSLRKVMQGGIQQFRID